MLKVLISGKPGKGFSALDDLANKGSHSWSSAPLSRWVALLAMRYGRAPLPVSHGLQKALVRRGVGDPEEFEVLARRYLFLGDAQILLAEARKRIAPISHSFEFARQASTERPTPPETGVRKQCP